MLAGYQALFAGFKRREVVDRPRRWPPACGCNWAPTAAAVRGADRAPLALIAAALVVVAILPGVWNGVGRTPTDVAGTFHAGHDRLRRAVHRWHGGRRRVLHSTASVLARMAGDQVRFLAVHSEQSAALAWRLVPSVEEVIEGIEGTAGANRVPSNGGSNIRGRTGPARTKRISRTTPPRQLRRLRPRMGLHNRTLPR